MRHGNGIWQTLHLPVWSLDFSVSGTMATTQKNTPAIPPANSMDKGCRCSRLHQWDRAYMTIWPYMGYDHTWAMTIHGLYDHTWLYNHTWAMTIHGLYDHTHIDAIKHQHTTPYTHTMHARTHTMHTHTYTHTHTHTHKPHHTYVFPSGVIRRSKNS